MDFPGDWIMVAEHSGLLTTIYLLIRGAGGAGGARTHEARRGCTAGTKTPTETWTRDEQAPPLDAPGLQAVHVRQLEE
jgi:hypothetical protein